MAENQNKKNGKLKTSAILLLIFVVVEAALMFYQIYLNVIAVLR